MKYIKTPVYEFSDLLYDSNGISYTREEVEEE